MNRCIVLRKASSIGGLYVMMNFMNILYVDIHSHLNLSPLSENKEAVLAKMRELGVGTITVGTGIATSRAAIKIAEENPDLCWATIGIHPCHTCADGVHDEDPDNVHEIFEDHAEEFEALARHEKVVAIGETGLDYFHNDTPEMRTIQEGVFRKHIELAIRVNKPLMLHVRASKGSDDAYYDALKILAEYVQPIQKHQDPNTKIQTGGVSDSSKTGLRANFHFFSGSTECMQAIVAAGYTVSVDGPITFTDQYDEMIRACPIESLMVETDSPFAAPKPYRGKPCEPWMVVEVAQRIAEIKGIEKDAAAARLLENARLFFGIGIE